MHILAIETSCDETAIAALQATGGLNNPEFKILNSAVASQIPVHAPWGGVVPNLAKREHLANLPIVLEETLKKLKNFKPDLICVTVGPGLEPALWPGIEYAKELKKEFPKAKLVGTNHLEGHLFSFLLSEKTKNFKFQILSSKLKKLFPAVALIVSGGHTAVLKIESLKKWKKLGETRDDAAGEAYDKVSKMLGLSYPGGPELERLAATGNPTAINFPRPMLNDPNYDFSFSGLKTSVLYHLRDNPNVKKEDVAASFQAAAVETLAKKVDRAAKEIGAKSIHLSGGVAANQALRQALKNISQKNKLPFLVAAMQFNTDNAVMIGVAGYLAYLRGKKLPLRANGLLNI
jgi:N6-L-threonylcarbamoyladenine synthase